MKHSFLTPFSLPQALSLVLSLSETRVHLATQLPLFPFLVLLSISCTIVTHFILWRPFIRPKVQCITATATANQPRHHPASYWHRFRPMWPNLSNAHAKHDLWHIDDSRVCPTLSTRFMLNAVWHQHCLRWPWSTCNVFKPNFRAGLKENTTRHTSCILHQLYWHPNSSKIRMPFHAMFIVFVHPFILLKRSRSWNDHSLVSSSTTSL